MVPLAIMLLLAIYVFTERYIAIRNASNIDQNFMNIVRDHIVSGNLVAARSFAKNSNNPTAPDTVSWATSSTNLAVGRRQCGLIKSACRDVLRTEPRS